MSNQMLLATGALFILTLLILLFYQSSTEQSSVSVENEAILAGTGIAQALIAEIQKRSFDERTVTHATYFTDSISVSGALGPDAGEVFITQFDDIDDFNNYSVTDVSTRLGDYKLSVDVDYVGNLAPDTKTFNRTFNKKVTVSISSTYLPDTLKFYHIIGY